jgi:hypothetical protein
MNWPKKKNLRQQLPHGGRYTLHCIACVRYRKFIELGPMDLPGGTVTGLRDTVKRKLRRLPDDAPDLTQPVREDNITTTTAPAESARATAATATPAESA